MPPRIPRRTREIELWDVNPIGNRAAWQREIMQFWSLMLTRGKAIRSPAYLFKDNEYAAQTQSRSRIPVKRPMTANELAGELSARLAANPAVSVGEAQQRSIETWFAQSAITPGERIRWLPGLPAAGLAIRHYTALATFNRAVTRLRYWAAFFYSALKSDLDYGDATNDRTTAGGLLDAFLGDGLDRGDRDESNGLTWIVDMPRLAGKDPEVYLPALALMPQATGPLPSIATGMPEGWLDGATNSDVYTEFLCPGTVILLRRALKALLGRSEETSHSAMADMVETALVNHAAIYYVRGMRVLNALTAGRGLPEDCARCWDRFQPDLAPAADQTRVGAWLAGDYQGDPTAEDANWVDENCSQGVEIFVNAGRKEQQNAKDLARLSFEGLRHQLSEYTVNRIMLKIAWDVARGAASESRPAPDSMRDIYPTLDRWYGERDTRLMLAAVWRTKIVELASDRDVPGAARALADAAGHSDDPEQLEGVARHLVGETILSSRAYGRYVEVLNSLLGGGALPTNQDPKGLVARGGTQATKFHLSINDRALETMVAIAAAEHEGRALSFQNFIDFLARRYGILIDRMPRDLAVSPGLVADASAESRQALRARLSSMGFLTEFSDSSDWNRVHWGASR
jgi:hypothetical protein